jgi:5'-nucleotidase
MYASPQARSASLLLIGLVALIAFALLSSTALSDQMPTPNAVTIKIVAFNDLHGHLEPPRIGIIAPATGAATVVVPAGGAAYMANAIQSLRAQNPHTAVVSAGDMIGASPLASALFLDEPTIEVVNAINIDFNAVGNHEFDKGSAELLRMQSGGCVKHTLREPCLLNKSFPGANFGFLAANVFNADGNTLFPATGIKEFVGSGYRIKVGFIGMTLRGTPAIVTPMGVAGLRFADEAATANALVPILKAQGADAIVVVLHEGATSSGGYNDKACPGLAGDLLPILDRLDPAIDVVVSGHTHRAYVCDYNKASSANTAKPLLLTSAGQYGTLVTDINLTVDPRNKRVVAKSANNLIVQSEGFMNAAGMPVNITPLYPSFTKDAVVGEIVATYVAAAKPLSQRVVGTLSASITRDKALDANASPESALGNLIADSQLAATRAPERGGAQLALMNPGGVRADLLVPAGGGPVTYGQIFSVQPFGNSLVVKSMTGAQIRAVLEAPFSSSDNPRALFSSKGFSYSYDLSRPRGTRLTDVRLDGVEIVATAVYRVTMNSFLASGGDGFAAFNEGSNAIGGELDVDALENFLKVNPGISPPVLNRIRKIK